MQDEKLQETQAWLQKATNDLRSAQVDLAADPPLIEDALFHCQQAAEKAMKAFLAAHDTTFRKTHDLDELALACEQIDASLKEALDPARDLTVFAWEFPTIPVLTKRHRRPKRAIPCFWLKPLWMPSGNAWGASSKSVKVIWGQPPTTEMSDRPQFT